MARACEECTQNCLIMHQKKKNPSPLMTSFFKVMMGDNYSKILYLPPKFNRYAKKLVGKEIYLEDFNGEKWNVKLTKSADHLAFKEGWYDFAVAHKLQKGDFLVFHYTMRSHFVVLMYGSTGCPENRHFGGEELNETKKNNDSVTANCQSPSKVNTDCKNFSHKSSFKSKSLDLGTNGVKTVDKVLNDTENTTKTPHLAASSSQPMDKETYQKPELVSQSTIPDHVCSNNNPTTVKPLVDDGNGHEQDECRRQSVQPVVAAVTDGGRKNMAGGGGVYHTEIWKSLETRLEKAALKRKASNAVQNEGPHGNSMHKRLRPADVPTTPTKIVIKEHDTSVSRLNDNAKPMEPITKEPTVDHGSGGLVRKEPIKKEPTVDHGSGGMVRKEPASNHGSGDVIKREPKPEPVDYDESPPSGSSNTSFSAIMASYQYLELPSWVKLKSKVILLRNGGDFWVVLYESKFGLKALTQNWGIFAKEKGIKLGDKCEFVLESEPNSRHTCNVFGVRVTR